MSNTFAYSTVRPCQKGFKVGVVDLMVVSHASDACVVADVEEEGGAWRDVDGLADTTSEEGR